MKIETLTDKIHQNADAELNRSLYNKFEPVFDLFRRWGGPQTVTVTHYPASDGKAQTAELNATSLLEALKSKAETLHRAANREKAIATFMQKVDTLTTEVEELKNSIPQ